VFFPIDCAKALDDREVLVLPREPRWLMYLTIGNRKPQA
jgi:hypothetical protein